MKKCTSYRLRILAGASAIGIAAALAAAPVSAQDQSQQAPSDSAGGIQTITVTAEFRKSNVQDTPIAITAVNSAMLEARGDANVVDAVTQAPNVTLTRGSASFGNGLTASIRGIGQYDPNPALEPGVGIYVDDVYYSQLTGSVLDLLDLDRVEVLRGPQGTLQGKNSIGGAVKMFSRQPTGDNTTTLQATYGDYNRVEFRGSGDFSLVPDKLFVRVSGVSKQQDGYVTRKDFGCAVPTLTYTDTSGVLHTNAPNPIPSMTGIKQNCVVGTEGGASYTAERLMLRWLATENIEDNFIADYTSDNSEGTPNTLVNLNDALIRSPIARLNVAYNGLPANTTKVPALIPSDPYVSYASFYMPGGLKLPGNGGASIPTSPLSFEDQKHLRSWGVSNTLDWKLLDNLSVKSITAYRRFDSSSASDGDASPLGYQLAEDNYNHWQLSEELRISGDTFNRALEYTFGGYYFDQDTIYSGHQDLLSTSALLDFLGGGPITATTKAGFVHAVWHVIPKLDVEAGLRYTSDTKTYTYSRLNGDTFGGAVLVGSAVPAPVACPVFTTPPSQDCLPNYNYGQYGLNGVASTANTERTDYRGAISYHWLPDLMTYFQFSTGFKGGGINPRPFYPQQVLPFPPETLKAYEIGFKSTVGSALRLNGAGFWNDYKGFQATIGNCSAQAGLAYGNPCALPISAGDATVWGVELEAEYHPVQNLSIDASGSYIHFKFDSISPGVTNITLSSIPPFTPTWKWSAGVQYELEIGNLGTVTPRIDANYMDSFFSSVENGVNGFVPQRFLMNAHLTWRSPDQSLSAALEVTNLADKFYYINKFDLIASGRSQAQPGEPREWAFTIKKKF